MKRHAHSRAAIRAVLGTLAAFGALMTIVGAPSCAARYDPNQQTAIVAPDYAFYRTYLDEFLVRRCGTLDCHGAPGRAYRMYGSKGYRLPTGTLRDVALVSGLVPTTQAETRANYEGIIALEPEEMSRVIARNGENPRSLLFLRKPLGTVTGEPAPDEDTSLGERHKGGRVLASYDASYKCIVGWLQYPVRFPPRDGAPLPDDAGAADAADGGGFALPEKVAEACAELYLYK